MLKAARRPTASSAGPNRSAAPPAGADDEGEEAGPDPRFAAADEALERGDFAAAEAEFDKLLQANPADAEAKAGKAQAGLFARASALDPQAVLAAAAAADATRRPTSWPRPTSSWSPARSRRPSTG